MADCVYCGEHTGEHAQLSDDTCGAAECERYIREQQQAEREEAHRRLDEELGYW